MTHPVGMLMTGCQKQQNILLAFHTYLELCEVKVLWDVDYDYEKNLDIIYIKAKLKKNSEKSDYYVPISTSAIITPEWISTVQKKILGNNHDSSFILVIKERDSSSVYYKVSSGLVPPLSPETTKRKKSLEEKNKYLRSELNKRKAQMFDEAKNSLLSTSTSVCVSNSDCKVVDVSNEDSNKSSSGNKDNYGSKDKSNEEIFLEDDDMPIEIIELYFIHFDFYFHS
ncbi:uncharacterized protein LOC142325207 isoform X2 [Lycorma delicatula]|uniref:uncharacterized protein LOC142325207 isoform X2 n=1 Tax=Lycorma delicatula TaxID=130591 RepID=UPI003F511100